VTFPSRSSRRRSFVRALGEKAMSGTDRLFAVTTVALGLAGTVALWFLGMLVANGFAWP
jgi:hypothetical protein